MVPGMSIIGDPFGETTIGCPDQECIDVTAVLSELLPILEREFPELTRN
jgi:hypothetical protein